MNRFKNKKTKEILEKRLILLFVLYYSGIKRGIFYSRNINAIIKSLSADKNSYAIFAACLREIFPQNHKLIF